MLMPMKVPADPFSGGLHHPIEEVLPVEIHRLGGHLVDFESAPAVRGRMIARPVGW